MGVGQLRGARARGVLHACLLSIALAFCAPAIATAEERTISLYSIHTKETLTIVYKRDGKYIPAAMKRINWQLRDWRRDESTKMDPKLIDLVWEMHRELGSRRPAHVISGYRSAKTNNMLRKTRGGQARRSQHILGRAIDVTFPDVSVRRMRYSALVREQGGVGYYPTSATPFVHVDTGRVRHWPRMSRPELALLFPHGRTRHRPRGGGPITRADAEQARRSHPALAQRVAAYHGFRRQRLIALRQSQGNTRLAALVRPPARPRPAVRPQAKPVRPAIPKTPKRAQVAALTSGWGYSLKKAPETIAPPPKLAKAPRLAARIPEKPPVATTGSETQRPSYDGDRLALLALASLPSPTTAPARPSAADQPETWVPAPAYDEEHPEELSYRPFPILPFITASASADDPALRQMVHPDVERTLEYLDDETNAGPPMQLRPGVRTASLLWAQAFSGRAVDLTAFSPRATKPALRPMLGQRRVATAGN